MIAKRNAKRALSLDSESSSYGGGGGGAGNREKFTQQHPSLYATNSSLNQSSVKIPLLYEQSAGDKSMSDINEMFSKPEQDFYSTLDNNKDQQNKRKSLFVSPTAEVMNYNKDKTHSRLLSGHFASEQHTRESSGVVTGSIPDLRHSRNPSIDANTEIRLTSPERSPPRNSNRGHRTVPSQYLESMFEE